MRIFDDFMDIKVIKNESKELVIEFQSKDMTMPDLLAHELMNDSDVAFAGVAKAHPEVGRPVLTIKTTKKAATSALESAIGRISDNIDSVRSGISKKK